MAVRVVMRRELPFSDVSRIMWRMWKLWGYSSRPCTERDCPPGWLVVEFWIHAPTATADVLASYEWELDEALLSPRVRARYGGGGSHIER